MVDLPPTPIWLSYSADLGDRLMVLPGPSLLPPRLRWWQLWWQEVILMWRDLWVGLTS